AYMCMLRVFEYDIREKRARELNIRTRRRERKRQRSEAQCIGHSTALASLELWP
ncbi:hypothetical protein HAX54_025166, partial [Datura stramonium]|nr:hypothetical protein [Datura stramonium]